MLVILKSQKSSGLLARHNLNLDFEDEFIDDDFKVVTAAAKAELNK